MSLLLRDFIFLRVSYLIMIRKNHIPLNLFQMCGRKNVHLSMFLIMLVIFLYHNYLLLA